MKTQDLRLKNKDTFKIVSKSIEIGFVQISPTKVQNERPVPNHPSASTPPSLIRLKKKWRDFHICQKSKK